MSWDIVVQDLPAGIRRLEEYPTDFKPKPIGKPHDLITAIKAVLPHAVFSDPTKGWIYGDGYSIEVELGKVEIVSAFRLRVHGRGDEVTSLVLGLLSHLGLSGIDLSAEEILTPKIDAIRGVPLVQANRERGVDAKPSQVNSPRRPLPGTLEVKGREFMYVECETNEGFFDLADPTDPAVRSLPLPQAGGAGEERVRVTLKNGISFMGISYKSDLEGWRKRYIGLCEKSGRRYGFIREGRLVLSDGLSSSIEELEIRYD